MGLLFAIGISRRSCSAKRKLGPRAPVGIKVSDEGPVSRKIIIFLCCEIDLISIGSSSLLTQWI